MGIGSGIFLIVVGAILAFALEPDTWEVVNLNVVGYIMMIGGVIGLIIALVVNAQRANTRHHQVVERHDNTSPPPAV